MTEVLGGVLQLPERTVDGLPTGSQPFPTKLGKCPMNCLDPHPELRRKVASGRQLTCGIHTSSNPTAQLSGNLLVPAQARTHRTTRTGSPTQTEVIATYDATSLDATMARFPRETFTRPSAANNAIARYAVPAATPYRSEMSTRVGSGSPGRRTPHAIAPRPARWLRCHSSVRRYSCSGFVTS